MSNRQYKSEIGVAIEIVVYQHNASCSLAGGVVDWMWWKATMRS